MKMINSTLDRVPCKYICGTRRMNGKWSACSLVPFWQTRWDTSWWWGPRVPAKWRGWWWGCLWFRRGYVPRGYVPRGYVPHVISATTIVRLQCLKWQISLCCSVLTRFPPLLAFPEWVDLPYKSMNLKTDELIEDRSRFVYSLYSQVRARDDAHTPTIRHMYIHPCTRYTRGANSAVQYCSVCCLLS